jgi:hypothetical protein
LLSIENFSFWRQQLPIDSGSWHLMIYVGIDQIIKTQFIVAHHASNNATFTRVRLYTSNLLVTDTFWKQVQSLQEIPTFDEILKEFKTA